MMTRRDLLGAGAALALLKPLLAAEAADARYNLIGDVVGQAVASGDVPGAVAVVWRDGQIRALQQAGIRDIQTRAPLEPSTLMGIASMTKPVTVAAAMALVERGRMRLEDPITRWAPEFASMRVLRRADGPLDETYPAPRLITVEDLTTHRAGFAYGFYTQGPLAAALISRLGMGIDSTMTPDEWLGTIAALPLAHAPGERFNYGHSIDVLGFIVGRAAGTDLQRVMREAILAPLGMEDTVFWIPPAKRTRAAQVYYSPTVGQFTRVELPSFTGRAPLPYASGGQGLVSTAVDYLKFARMLLGKGQLDGRRVLRAESVRRMTTDVLTAEQRRFPAFNDPRYWERWGQGLGMTVLRDPGLAGTRAGIGSFGWGGAFGGWWQADPTRNAILLWMQQCLPAPPIPGAPPAVRGIPGSGATLEFQARAYAALE